MSTLFAESSVVPSQLFLPFAQPESEPEVAVENPTSGSTAATTEEPAKIVCRVAEDGTKRISEPVRVGTVMIKLLKRYGITDEEISQGLQDYAAKHQVATAS